VHGSLVEPAIEDEPDEPSDNVAKLLDEAENIVNAVVPEARAEAAARERVAQRMGWLQRFRRSGFRRGGSGRSPR
jgi:hypothetical protein